jgi:hypothetical protein
MYNWRIVAGLMLGAGIALFVWPINHIADRWGSPWSLVALIYLSYLVAVGFFVHHIIHAHPELWVQLGRPSIFLLDSFFFLFCSLRSGTFVFGYIWGSRYKSLNDIKLNRLALLVKCLFLLFFGTGGWAMFWTVS